LFLNNEGTGLKKKKNFLKEKTESRQIQSRSEAELLELTTVKKVEHLLPHTCRLKVTASWCSV